MPDRITTPDFDTYPMRHRLVDARCIEGGVELRWTDQRVDRVPLIWLREYSPDERSMHPVTREPMVSPIDLPQHLEVGRLAVRGDALEIDWQPEGIASTYHAGWLRHHLEPSDPLPGRWLWEPETDPVTVDGPALLSGDGSRWMTFAETLHVQGVVRVCDLPVEPANLIRLVEQIGPVRTTNFGHLFEVTNRPDQGSNAYTAIRLAAHSDLATREYMPGLQFLFCLHNDASGGESVLVDGFAAAERLRALDPDAYTLLSTRAIEFSTRSVHSDHRHVAPVLEHDREGRLSSVRYTWWLRTPMAGEFEEIQRYYAAFRRLQECIEAPDAALRLRLSAGDLLAFDNRRVLHGRDAFDPQSGERNLIGCYCEREELESCLRMMQRRQREYEAGGEEDVG